MGYIFEILLLLYTLNRSSIKYLIYFDLSSIDNAFVNDDS